MAMRHSLLVGALAAVCLLAAGCGPQGKPGPVKGSAAEVALFQGGYGIDFFEQAAKDYEKANPGVKLRVWGNPRIWEQLRPRFVAGSPPDLAWPGWGMDYWPLVYEGQLAPWDDALDGPPAAGTGTWRDTFEPSLLAMGQHEGKQYMLPYFFNVHGWWYDRTLFAERGWKPPATFEALMALCERMLAEGVAPITYQGKYPDYVITGMLLPWAVSAGGVEAVDAAQNLEPGAWESPAMLKAAQMIADLRDRGYLQKGAIGMSHTEAQMEFVAGRAAMIPCGTWLHSEMANQLKGSKVRMTFILPPVLEQGPGDKTALAIGIEPWVVPAKGKHREEVIGFYKHLTSLPKAMEFVEQKGTLMAIKGSDAARLPDYLIEPARAFRKSGTVWSVEFIQWYPSLGVAARNAMTALLSGKATPAVFCRRVEEAAEKVRQDSTVPRHTVVR